MPTEKPRIIVTMDKSLFDAIEDFRFENRFQSRSETVVHLIRRGIAACKESGDSRISRSDTPDIK